MDLEKILPVMLSGIREGEADTIKAFISECGLHIEDLTPEKLRHFIVARKGSKIVGTVGIEPAGSDALLRSLAVSESIRRQGLGTQLTESIEKYARDREVRHLYVLTRTAESFFSSVGYKNRIAPRPLPASKTPKSSGPSVRTRLYACKKNFNVVFHANAPRSHRQDIPFFGSM